jgi:hypothetical protein
MATNAPFKIKMIMPAKLKKFLDSPDPFIQGTMKEANKDVRQLLKKKISEAAPKRSGNLSNSIEESETGNKVFTKSVYGRAVEMGHYAEPRGKFLHFVDGGKDVFIKFTRTRKHPYFFLAADRARLDALDIYDKAYKKLLESV